MTTTIDPSVAAKPSVKTAAVQPCCLAISSDMILGVGAAADMSTRRWRALSIDDRKVLTSGELTTNMDDPLAVVRDKAVSAARSLGFEPQQFILEKTN
ncbi:hypothetical protein B7486_11325 [cyanobacterium TDX16]|nr:hypothetical protein B7486_11325 [cyanobacterium TDX16]